MNKLALLLPILLFACGSEVADPQGVTKPAPAQTSAPGAPDTEVTAAPAAAPPSSSRDHDIAANTDESNTHRVPSITPAPSTLPAVEPPATIDPSTTTDPSTLDPTSPTTDASDTSSDPPATTTDATIVDPTPPATTDVTPTITTDPTPPPPAPSTDPCAPTSSGNTPNGKSKGTGSQGGEGSSIYACGGPL